MIASGMSAGLNFVIIYILNILFTQCATYLTNLEMPKSDAAFEKSFTLKMFIFQAVNYWSCIFYIAFIKGHGTGTPVEYTRFGGTSQIRLEECHPAGLRK